MGIMGYFCTALLLISVISVYGKSDSLVAPKKIDEILEFNSKYNIRWSIDEGSDKIVFVLNVETKGFVGFGLSHTGGMDAADMIIGGVFENGTTYFSDRFGGKGMTTVDASQDWELIDAEETDTHTTLTVSRLLDTCDKAQDIAITMDTAKLIWSFGRTDEIAQHGRDDRGTRSMNLLAPPKTADMSGFKVWNITATTIVPSHDTTYWCTFHKSPTPPAGQNKLHIVGWDVIQLSETAAKYTHHVDVKKCIAPENSTAEEIFDRFVDPTGVSCYDNPGDYPIHYCESYIMTWAVGRGLTLLPEEVGYAFAQTSNDVYYVLEVHYDNPTLDEDIPEFLTGLKVYYTETPREVDADLLGIGHYTIFTMAIPPRTDNYVISGHCPSECTNLFPETGLTVFGTLLHAHLSGRKLKLRHFRNGKELPWVASDNNFDFNFQENKPVALLKVLPGDSFTFECTYSSMWKNGSSVVAGLGSRDEMCVSWLWYYPKIKMNYCYSFYPLAKNMEDFGIQNYTWNDKSSPFLPPPVIWAPERMYNKTYQEVMDNFVDWTPDKIEKTQNDHRYGEHDFFCHSVDGGFLKDGQTKYVEIDEEYTPQDTCAGRNAAFSLIVSFPSTISFIILTVVLGYYL